MNKLSKEEVDNFIKVTPFSLFPSQKKICLPHLNRILHMQEAKIIIPPIKVDEQLIVDGHHRYLASKIAGTSIEYRRWTKADSVMGCNWSEIVIVTDDWYNNTLLKETYRYYANFNNQKLDEFIKRLQF